MSAPIPVKRFIPYTRHDLLKMTLNTMSWTEDEQKALTSIASLLSDLFHFEYHRDLETLKNTYVELIPDRDTRQVFSANTEAKDNQSTFINKLEDILTAANYDEISRAELEQALASESLVKLQLHVNFDDFEKVLFYGRGEQKRSAVIESWFGLRKIPVNFKRYDRVVIFFQIKESQHFSAREIPQGLIPGATLLKLFRNVPKADLEMLFPNTEVRMRLFDKLLIGVPAVVSGGVVLTTKLGSTLLLIAAFASFWLGFRNEPVVLDQTALIALAAGLATLGGFFWKQFSKFKNRKIQFMKTLTDNLYFRNLDNNAGVFYRLIDDAEEEEFKEAFLAYAFLFNHAQQSKNSEGLNKQELDKNIETWFQNTWDTTVDFEIDDALQKLLRLKLVKEQDNRLLPVTPSDAHSILEKQWKARSA